MKRFTIRILFMLAVVPAIAAGCKNSGSTAGKNSVSVEKATADEVVLRLTAKAGTKIWLEAYSDGGGLCCTPDREITARVIYKKLAHGYSIDGEGLAYSRNSQAGNVVFLSPPMEQNGRVEIGTYSQWGSDALRITFKLE